MSTDPVTPGAIAEDHFDLDEWLETGTVARRSVEIYNDPALMAEYEQLDRELTRAKARAGEGGDPEASVGDVSEVDQILTRMEDLSRRWEASRATWTVRALDPEEIQEVADLFPDEPIPPLLAGERPEPGTPEAAERAAAGAAYLTKQQAVLDQRNFALVAAAVVEVTTTRGTATTVTPEQVARLHARKPHGKQQAAKLIEAVNQATNGEADIPRPTSPGRSAGARD